MDAKKLESQVNDIAGKAIDAFTEIVDSMDKEQSFIFANHITIIAAGFIHATYGEKAHDTLLVELLKRPKEVFTQQTKH